MFPAFLWTYSRQAFLAIGIAITSLFTLRKRRYFLIAVVLLLITVAISPLEVRHSLRSIVYSFHSENQYYSSWGSRLYTWRMVLPDFLHYPLLGVGLGARHRSTYDSQYIMELCELGLAGLVCFSWLLLETLRLLVVSWRRHDDAFLKALALGVLTGFIGISLQAAASSVFIVTRIAGPFWFLLGIIVRCNKIKDRTDTL
jgi:O-antigen ligase